MGLLFTVCLGMLIIIFWKYTFMDICHSIRWWVRVNLCQFHVDDIPYRSATTLRSWRTVTTPVMSGVCCQTVRSTDWGKDAQSCLCPREAAEQRTATYRIYGSICSVNNVSRSRDRNLVPLPGPVYWLLALTSLDGYSSSAHHKKAP